MLIKLELQVIFQYTDVGLILLNILFFIELLLNGTKCIWILEMHLLQFLKSTYNLILIQFTTFASLLAYEHRFDYNFVNCVNPLCTCSLEAETTSFFHCFFLHCHHYNSVRLTLFNELCEIDMNL